MSNIKSEKYRGTQPVISFRLTPEKKQKLDKILASLDCTWGDRPTVGALIQGIIAGNIILTKVK